jgi:hypothetical protein
MENIFERVVGSHSISMLDGYSGYNHIAVLEEDKQKITFTTPWGTVMYEKMPFSMMNVGATSQMTMEISFVGKRKIPWLYTWMTSPSSQSMMISIYNTWSIFFKNAEGMESL